MVDISHIRNIAVIGAGVQGHSVTQAALMAGFEKVILNDINLELIEKAANQIENDEAFVRAGTMHNFSYLGGLLGIITGCVFILLERKALLKSMKDSP